MVINYDQRKLVMRAETHNDYVIIYWINPNRPQHTAYIEFKDIKLKWVINAGGLSRSLSSVVISGVHK